MVGTTIEQSRRLNGHIDKGESDAHVSASSDERQLLLMDLCGRLPYEVIVNIEYNKEHGSSDRLRICSEGDLQLGTDVLGLFIEGEIYLKPYLRPMSSMTEEEKEEFENLLEGIVEGIERWDKPDLCEEYDWLNAHHFDYRGLIPMGLALEAKDEMYI